MTPFDCTLGQILPFLCCQRDQLTFFQGETWKLCLILNYDTYICVPRLSLNNTVSKWYLAVLHHLITYWDEFYHPCAISKWSTGIFSRWNKKKSVQFRTMMYTYLRSIGNIELNWTIWWYIGTNHTTSMLSQGDQLTFSQREARKLYLIFDYDIDIYNLCSSGNIKLNCTIWLHFGTSFTTTVLSQGDQLTFFLDETKKLC